MSTELVKCRYRCGWFREWSVGPQGYIDISHPVYGTITPKQAAARDINSHDCTTYIEARDKVRRLRWGLSDKEYAKCVSVRVTAVAEGAERTVNGSTTKGQKRVRA